MAFHEKRAWIMLVVATVSYAVYLVIVLGRIGATPVARIHYVPPLLQCIGASIVASIVLEMIVSSSVPKDETKADQRDREIGRAGERTGQSMLVVGGVAALGLAVEQADYFWIANVIYLAFVVSALISSATRIVAYRWGFRAW